MEIVDKDVLSTVMKALYVAKWESDDDNAHVMELAGSPYLANAFHELVDEIVRLDSSREDAKAKWARWRALEHRPTELERTRERIRKHERIWKTWTTEEKLAMVKILISPFTATETTLMELVAL